MIVRVFLTGEEENFYCIGNKEETCTCVRFHQERGSKTSLLDMDKIGGESSFMENEGWVLKDAIIPEREDTGAVLDLDYEDLWNLCSRWEQNNGGEWSRNFKWELYEDLVE